MQVDTKQDVLALLERHKADLQISGVSRLGLFGSFVRNEPRPESDIDFLIEFIPGRKTFDNLIRVGDYLESLFSRRVELVTPEALSPHLRPHIVKEVEYVRISD